MSDHAPTATESESGYRVVLRRIEGDRWLVAMIYPVRPNASVPGAWLIAWRGDAFLAAEDDQRTEWLRAAGDAARAAFPDDSGTVTIQTEAA